MRASAVKRGRNPRFPYVPVVVHEDGRTHNTNTRNAYATREEAVAYAEKWVAASVAATEAAAARYAARRAA
jgi:hypothetical protein